MNYYQRPPHTPEQREKHHLDMVRCWWVFIIIWAILCLLSAGCQPKAWAQRPVKAQPISSLGIRDAERPAPTPHTF